MKLKEGQRMKDTLGVEILPTDHVLVTSYGYGARLVDTGHKSRVVRFTPSRVVIFDADGRERAAGPTCLAVLRRDGNHGLEGNAR